MFRAYGRYLSAYYADTEVPKSARDGYESVLTVVSISDVFINNVGYFWNEKVSETYLDIQPFLVW